MKAKEVRAVKEQLQQLDMELRRFKAELLTARVAEIEQVIGQPGAGAHPGLRRAQAASHSRIQTQAP